MQWKRAIVVAAVAAPCGVTFGQTWIRQFGTAADDGTSCAVAGAGGEIYAGGGTRGDFAAPNAGDVDAWFARFDESGTALWKRQIGSSAADELDAVVTDGSGGAWFLGSTLGELGGPGAGDRDLWLARVDAQGEILQLVQSGTEDGDWAAGAVTDGSGGLILAGTRAEPIGEGYYDQPSVHVARHGPLGEPLWAVALDTEDWESVAGIASDGAGGAFVGGSTYGSLGGPNLGKYDAWLARYDATGALLLLMQWGSPEDDHVSALASDGSGGAYVLWNETIPYSLQRRRSLRHVDAAGQELWDRWLGTDGWYEKGLVFAVSDGGTGMVAGGWSRERECAEIVGNADAWLLGSDFAGHVHCLAQLGTRQSDVATAFVALPGRSFAFGSTSGTLGGPALGSGDAWMARFDDQAVEPYCTAGTTSNGCAASIGGTGTPSTSASSGFTIDVDGVDGQRAGFLFYGLASKAEDPWGASSSYLCVRGPWQRTPVQTSGGTEGACDGSFQLDWNAYRASTYRPIGFPFFPGDYLYSQAWFRDPLATEGSQLSDALAFVLQP